MRSLFSSTSSLGRSVVFSAQPIPETLPNGSPQVLRWLYLSLETCFFPLPLVLPALRRKELRHQREQSWGRDCRKRLEGNSRLWAAVYLVASLRGRDAVLAIENNVCLLGFVGVCPIDLLRGALQFLLGYGIADVGETLWEELGEGYFRARGRPGGKQLSVCIPSWAPSRSQQRGRGAAVRRPSDCRAGA